MAAQRSVFLDPTADGSKVQFDAFGAATDWQAVSKGVRQPTAPSSGSGIRCSDSNFVERLELGTFAGLLNPGEHVSFLRVWFYLGTAIPANHSLSVAHLSGGQQVGSAVAIPSGTASGWVSSPKLTAFRADGSFSNSTHVQTAQLILTESATQAANTEITAVYLEVGLSTMEHLKVSGNQIVGVTSGNKFRATMAQYGSIAFDQWWEGADRGLGAIEKFRARGLQFVRIFPQFGSFMVDENTVNEPSFDMFAEMLDVCVQCDVRVDVAGLTMFLNMDVGNVPPWLDALSEANRWATFARWWAKMAEVCANSPAVVVYDLINEPLTQDGGSYWYTNPGFLSFGAYLVKNMSGRTNLQIATAFFNQMKTEIQRWDRKPIAFGDEGFEGAFVDVSEVALVHMYMFGAAASPTHRRDHIEQVMGYGVPVIMEETGRLDQVWGVDHLQEFWRIAWQKGMTAIAGNWNNPFSPFETDQSFKEWRRKTLMMNRTVELDRVNGVKSMANRVGQRFR